jgi:hypothetical protein
MDGPPRVVVAAGDGGMVPEAAIPPPGLEDPGSNGHAGMHPTMMTPLTPEGAGRQVRPRASSRHAGSPFPVTVRWSTLRSVGRAGGHRL